MALQPSTKCHAAIWSSLTFCLSACAETMQTDPSKFAYFLEVTGIALCVYITLSVHLDLPFSEPVITVIRIFLLALTLVNLYRESYGCAAMGIAALLCITEKSSHDFVRYITYGVAFLGFARLLYSAQSTTDKTLVVSFCALQLLCINMEKSVKYRTYADIACFGLAVLVYYFMYHIRYTFPGTVAAVIPVANRLVNTMAGKLAYAIGPSLMQAGTR